MKADATAVKNLQAAAGLEAALKNMGLKKVAKMLDHCGDNCSGYLEKIISRLLFFETAPSYDGGKASERGGLTEILQGCLAGCTSIVAQYQQFCKQAWDVLDDGTRNLYEHLIKWHEDDIDKLERELSLIQELTEKEYIAARI